MIDQLKKQKDQEITIINQEIIVFKEKNNQLNKNIEKLLKEQKVEQEEFQVIKNELEMKN